MTEYDKKRSKDPARVARMKEYRHKSYLKNKERVRQAAKEWKKANPEKNRESNRQSDQRNIETRRNAAARRKAADPIAYNLQIALYAHNRRASIRGVSTKPIQKEVIHNWHSRVCGICKKLIADDFHLDHIIPLSRGGSHSTENLQLAHPKCNRVKHNKLTEELGVVLS